MESDPSASGTHSVPEMMNQLWIKFVPQIEERVATLERASDALGAGELPLRLREEAHSAAHKLAGTLGMFGLEQGTALAREAENLLGPETNLDPAAKYRIRQLATEIRSIICSRT